jgi:endo-1,4-beta-xylanase
LKYFLLLITLSITLLSCKKNTVIEDTKLSGGALVLKDLANLASNADFNIGITLIPYAAPTAEEKAFMDRTAPEFDQTTLSNQMGAIVTRDGYGVVNYNYTALDGYVDYATSKGLAMHLQCLFYPLTVYTTGESVPGFMPRFLPLLPNVTQQDKDYFKKIVMDYLTAVVTRYKGKIRGYVVINEVFKDNGTGANNTWLRRRFSSDAELYTFIGEMYKTCHAADPNAILFYNDYYQEESTAKGILIKNQLNAWLAAGVPISGYGLQFHTVAGKSKAAMQDALALAATTGLKIHMSELDVSVNNEDIHRGPITTSMLLAQRTTFKEAAEAYKTSIPKAQQYGITMWDTNDAKSWFIGAGLRPNTKFEASCMYDANYGRKPAYYGFAEGLSGKDYSKQVQTYINFRN